MPRTVGGPRATHEMHHSLRTRQVMEDVPMPYKNNGNIPQHRLTAEELPESDETKEEEPPTGLKG